jgi:hypothetical protein
MCAPPSIPVTVPFIYYCALTPAWTQIRCRKDPSCSGRTETVIITDMNYYPVSKYHFDLSGTAFGRLAKPGLNDKLRHSGIIDIEFTRSVVCVLLNFVARQVKVWW